MQPGPDVCAESNGAIRFSILGSDPKLLRHKVQILKFQTSNASSVGTKPCIEKRFAPFNSAQNSALDRSIHEAVSVAFATPPWAVATAWSCNFNARLKECWFERTVV